MTFYASQCPITGSWSVAMRSAGVPGRKCASCSLIHYVGTGPEAQAEAEAIAEQMATRTDGICERPKKSL